MEPGQQCVHCGFALIPDVWPVLGQGKKAPGAKKAVYIHHIIQDMPRPKNFNTLMANLQEKFCFDLIKYHFDKIITVNQDVVDGLRRRGFTQPILVSSNFVNDHNIQPVAYENKEITFAFVGRLVNQKGINDFLYVCEQLQPYIPGFKAVMIGAGPEMDRIKRHIEAKKLNIEVTGFVTESRKFELLAQSKLFIFPSVEEGWGIVIAESLSVGTPVIAYDLPVYKEPFGSVIKTVPLSDKEKLTEMVKHQLVTYQKNPAQYGNEQLSLLRRATMYSRDTVVGKEFAFLMGDIDE